MVGEGKMHLMYLTLITFSTGMKGFDQVLWNLCCNCGML